MDFQQIPQFSLKNNFLRDSSQQQLFTSTREGSECSLRQDSVKNDSYYKTNQEFNNSLASNFQKPNKHPQS